MRGIFLGVLLLAGTLLTACSGDNSFQKQAYALGKSYELAQKGAITYIEVAQPSSDVTGKIAAADQKAAPLVKDVLACAKSMLAGEPPAPEPAAAELGLDAEEAQEATCDGLLSEALLALNALRDVVNKAQE